jgi:hypothetical protein
LKVDMHSRTFLRNHRCGLFGDLHVHAR